MIFIEMGPIYNKALEDDVGNPDLIPKEKSGNYTRYESLNAK